MKLKSELDETGHETANQRQNRKVELFHQSLVVSKWIESFDSKNINDFTQSGSRTEEMPQLAHQLNMQFKDALDEVKNIQLSPNLANLNKHLKATKDRLGPEKVFGQRAASLALSPKSKLS